jgi:hypothetical protein
MEQKKYKHKSLTFDPKNEVELELWEWLRKLPHGTFAEETKQYWMDKMKEEQGNGNGRI